MPLLIPTPNPHPLSTSLHFSVPILATPDPLPPPYRAENYGYFVEAVRPLVRHVAALEPAMVQAEAKMVGGGEGGAGGGLGGLG